MDEHLEYFERREIPLSEEFMGIPVLQRQNDEFGLFQNEIQDIPIPLLNEFDNIPVLERQNEELPEVDMNLDILDLDQAMPDLLSCDNMMYCDEMQMLQAQEEYHQQEQMDIADGQPMESTDKDCDGSSLPVHVWQSNEVNDNPEIKQKPVKKRKPKPKHFEHENITHLTVESFINVRLWNINKLIGSATTVRLTDQIFKSVEKSNNHTMKKSRPVMFLPNVHKKKRKKEKNGKAETRARPLSLKRKMDPQPSNHTESENIKDDNTKIRKIIKSKKSQNNQSFDKLTSLPVKCLKGDGESSSGSIVKKISTSTNSVGFVKQAPIKAKPSIRQDKAAKIEIPDKIPAPESSQKSRFGRIIKPKKLHSDYISEFHADMHFARNRSLASLLKDTAEDSDSKKSKEKELTSKEIRDTTEEQPLDELEIEDNNAKSDIKIKLSFADMRIMRILTTPEKEERENEEIKPGKEEISKEEDKPKKEEHKSGKEMEKPRKEEDKDKTEEHKSRKVVEKPRKDKARKEEISREEDKPGKEVQKHRSKKEEKPRKAQPAPKKEDFEELNRKSEELKASLEKSLFGMKSRSREKPRSIKKTSNEEKVVEKKLRINDESANHHEHSVVQTTSKQKTENGLMKSKHRENNSGIDEKNVVEIDQEKKLKDCSPSVVENGKVEPLILKKVLSKSPEKGIPQDCFVIEQKKSPSPAKSPLKLPTTLKIKNSILRLKKPRVELVKLSPRKLNQASTHANHILARKKSSPMKMENPEVKIKKLHSRKIAKQHHSNSTNAHKKETPIIPGHKQAQKPIVNGTRQAKQNEQTAPILEEPIGQMDKESELPEEFSNSNIPDEDESLPDLIGSQESVSMDESEVDEPSLIKPLPPVVCYEKTLIKDNIYLVSQEGGQLKLMIFDGEICQPICHEYMVSRAAQLNGAIYTQ